MSRQDLFKLINLFYDALMIEISKNKSKNLIWLYFLNNKKQSALMICAIICIVFYYPAKKKTILTAPPSGEPKRTKIVNITHSPLEDTNSNQDNYNLGAELVYELLFYIGMLLILTALFCLTVEFAVGGTGLVIGIWGLSLAIEHVIAGLLVIGTSCFAASASVHYVYELSLENKEDSQNNNNLLNIKP